MISPSHIEFTQTWLDHFRDILADVPSILHSREVDGNGAPQWSPAFRAWLTSSRPGREGQGEDRIRLRRAMKQLHLSSLREYEVLVRVMEGSQPIPEVTKWLNERAIRGGHPERYTDNSTLTILWAAVDKLHAWY